jgi:type II secretory pathway predicted ATPase ExeA
VPDRASLLQSLLFDLGLPHEGRSEQQVRLALTDHLLQNFRNSGPTVFLIDEAQHLSADLLEELRLLGNLEAPSGKAVQVVLVGQTSLLETLRRPELASLRQRAAVRVELEPMEVQEAADYLLHHLRVAGGKPEAIITDEAVELLANATRGVPRLLNQAANQALRLTEEGEAEQVDVESVLEALEMLGLPVNVAASADTEPEKAGVLASVHLADNGEGQADTASSCHLFEAPIRPA